MRYTLCRSTKTKIELSYRQIVQVLYTKDVLKKTRMGTWCKAIRHRQVPYDPEAEALNLSSLFQEGGSSQDSSDSDVSEIFHSPELIEETLFIHEPMSTEKFPLSYISPLIEHM